VDLLVEGGIVKSKREGARVSEHGAILINGRVPGRRRARADGLLLHGEVLLIRRGKKLWHVVRFS